jgi:hypothetical protein
VEEDPRDAYLIGEARNDDDVSLPLVLRPEWPGRIGDK